MTQGTSNRRTVVYRVCVSVALGLVGFWLNFYPVVLEFPPHRAVFMIGLVLPMVVALAWGWRYGLLSATLGLGCQSGWFLWRGWGLLATVPPFTLWVVWHGWCAERYRRTGRLRWGPLAAEVPFRVFNLVVLYTVLRYAYTFNPAPWDPDFTRAFIPIDVVHVIAVKEIVNAVIVLLAAHVALSLGAVRSVMRLKPQRSQRTTSVVVSASILLGCIYWVVDATVQYLALRPSGGRLIDYLVLDVSVAHAIIRMLFMVSSLSVGLLVAWYLRAQRQSEERFRHLAELLPEIIFETDETGRLTFVNRQSFVMTGYTEEDFARGLRVTDVVMPFDRHRVLKNMTRVLRGETGRGNEYTVQRRDGTTFKAIVRSSVVTRDGKPVGLRGILVDISEREAAERALRESEKRYRAVVEDLPVLVCRFGPELRLTFVNEAYCRYFSRRAEDLIGVDFTELVPEEDREEVRARIASLDPAHPMATYEHRVVTADGETRWQRWTDRVLQADDGSISYQSIGEDITEQRYLEEQLRHSQKMEAIGQLAGGVAHDFNNLLTGIMGYAELLKYRLPEDEDAITSVDAILETSRRAAQLTAQLLAFARAGTVQTVPVDVHDVICEVTGLLKHTIDRCVEIRHELQAASAVILGDPTQLENAVLNLAVNARDAMSEGGTLTFGTQVVRLDDVYCRTQSESLRPGRYLELTVSDTGEGIPEDIRGRIFDPFFTTKDVGKGTGLGLAAVYGTVKRHHGVVRVDSESGRGSAFRLYLPLVTDEQPVDRDARDDGLIFGTGRILLVDDESVIRNMAWEMLRRLGYELILAADGEEAMTVYRRRWREIDLVILDVVMPRMSGLEVLSELRRINPRVRVLIATGFSRGVELEKVLADGDCDTVQKPFVMSQLSRKVAEALGKGAGVTSEDV